MRRFAIGFCLAVSAGMVLQWTLSFASGNVPELQTRPEELAAHLIGEALTATMLAAAAIGLWARRRWAATVAALATGMLLYTVIVSAGYFWQQGQPLFMVMLAIFLGGAASVAVWLARSAR